MRRVLRLLLVVGLLGGLLAVSETSSDPEPAKAEAVPIGDGVCTPSIPTSCADEAVAMGITISQAVALADEGFDFLSDSDPCSYPELHIIGCQAEPGATWVEDLATFYSADEATKILYCALWPSWWVCEQWLEEQEEANETNWSTVAPEALGAPDYAGTSWGSQTWAPRQSMSLVVLDASEFVGCPATATTTTEPCWFAGVDAEWQYTVGSPGANSNAGGGLYGFVSSGNLHICSSFFLNAAPWQTSQCSTAIGEVDELVPVVIWQRDPATAPSAHWISVFTESACGGEVGLGGSCAVISHTGTDVNFLWGILETTVYPRPMGTQVEAGRVTHVRRWFDVFESTASATSIAMRELIEEFPGYVTPPAPTFPATPNEVEPVPEAPPAVPVPIPPAVPDPAPAPEVNPVTTPNTGEQGWFDILGNRIGAMFDGLGSLIGGAFDWLGDLMRDLLEWLVDRLWEMVQWLGDALGGLLEWLGQLLGMILRAIQTMTAALGQLLQQLFGMLQSLLTGLGGLLQGIWNAVASLPDFLIDIANWIASLPGLIFDLFADFLDFLFVPENLDSLDYECSDIWPCSWVEELVAFLGGIGDIAASPGGCVAPGIGWEEFTVSAPPPSGCSAAAGNVAGSPGNAGDLFGWRVPVRMAALLLFSIAYVIRVVQMTPWAEREHYRLNHEQQTLFD